MSELTEVERMRYFAGIIEVVGASLRMYAAMEVFRATPSSDAFLVVRTMAAAHQQACKKLSDTINAITASDESVSSVIAAAGNPDIMKFALFIDDLRQLMRVETEDEMRYWAKIVGEREVTK